MERNFIKHILVISGLISLISLGILSITNQGSHPLLVIILIVPLGFILGGWGLSDEPWGLFSRPDLFCDGNSCGGYDDEELLFERDEEGLFPITIKHAGYEYEIYIYYCPWCGRNLKA